MVEETKKEKRVVRRCKLLPCADKEIPSQEELMQFGRYNLKRLAEIIEQVQRLLDIGEDLSTHYPEGSPFWIYDNSIFGIMITLRHYYDALKEAQEKTRANLPAVPEWRGSDWVKPGDRVVAYIVEAKSSKRILYPCLTMVDEVTRVEKPYSGPKVYDLQLTALKTCRDSEGDSIQIDSPLSYDSRSPYLLRADEVKYLRRSRRALELWMEYCGYFDTDPQWTLGMEQKDALRAQFRH